MTNTAKSLGNAPHVGNEELLTVSEVAKRLKVADSWVYKRTLSGFPSLRVGHFRRFLWPEIMQYLKQASGTY